MGCTHFCQCHHHLYCWPSYHRTWLYAAKFMHASGRADRRTGVTITPRARITDQFAYTRHSVMRCGAALYLRCLQSAWPIQHDPVHIAQHTRYGVVWRSTTSTAEQEKTFPGWMAGNFRQKGPSSMVTCIEQLTGRFHTGLYSGRLAIAIASVGCVAAGPARSPLRSSTCTDAGSQVAAVNGGV